MPSHIGHAAYCNNPKCRGNCKRCLHYPDHYYKDCQCVVCKPNECPCNCVKCLEYVENIRHNRTVTNILRR